MIKMLNRIAWILSFLLARVFAGLVSRIFYDSGFDSFFINDFIFWSLTLILMPFVKEIFLPKRVIEKALKSEGAQTIMAKMSSEVKPEERIQKTVPKKANQESETTTKTENVEESKIIADVPEVEISKHISTSESTEGVSEDSESKPAKPMIPPKPKTPNFIQRFFAENVLAKIGGILLFLGVLFLLRLVYGAIGPVGKLVTGFAIGFTIYGIGVLLDKKKLVKESRILMGTSILINYLVILSGRFLIGEGTFTEDMLLNEGLTFILLIMNTIFAVFTALLYRSHALLFFSFVFAYLNPFLIGAEAGNTPYTLLGYGLIISFGAIALSYFLRKEKDIFAGNLLTVAFIGGNLLFLVAPFVETTGWLLKLAATGILSFLCITTAFKTGKLKYLGGYFIGAYLYFMLLIFYGTIELSQGFHSIAVVLGYVVFVVVMLVMGAITFTATSGLLILTAMAMPLLITLGAGFSGIFYFTDILVLSIGALIAYLAIFVYIAGSLAVRLQYAFFAVIGVFICLCNVCLTFFPFGFTDVISNQSIPQPISVSIAIFTSAFIFQISTYFFSKRKDLQYLYSMGSAMAVIMLLTVITRDGNLVTASVISIAGYLFLNLLMPFINKNLVESKVRNVVLGLIAAVLFTSGEIFYFGEKYFSGLQIGVAFLAEAILYFLVGYGLFVKISKISVAAAKDVIYTMLGISISLFSLAIAFVFSKHSEVISAVWLFEASLMFFFYYRTKDLKIFAAGIILMGIGLWQLFELIDRVVSEEYLSLIPLSIIGGAFVINLKFLQFEKRHLRWFHDLPHLIGIGLIAGSLVQIIPSHGHGMAIFGSSIAILILAIVYSRLFCSYLPHIFTGIWILLMVNQILSLPDIQYRLNRDAVEYLMGVQYIATGLFFAAFFLFNRFLNLSDRKEEPSILKLGLISNVAVGIYLFIITSMYVFHLFDDNIFMITIYWGILTAILLNYGIQKDIIRWRTLGLYILILTVSKILFFDVWLGLDNAVIRILALMLVGALMIGISILYQKKFDGNLKKELLPQNLK